MNRLMEIERVYDKIIRELSIKKSRSHWEQGVTEYAEWMARIWRDSGDLKPLTKDFLLNGASDWIQASWEGSWYIYDEDIAKTLCTPSELKRTDYGRKKPNKAEEWLDVQARALYQASLKVIKAYNKVV